MISYKEMKRLSAEAQDKFPLSQEQIMILGLTGERACTLPTSEERVLWMLNQAFEIGKKNKNET